MKLIKIRSEGYDFFLEKLGFPKTTIMGKSTYTRAMPPLADHIHKDSFEFVYLHTGFQPFFIGNQEYIMRGGEQFFTQPNIIHSTAGKPMEKSVLYWLIFPMTIFDKNALNLTARENNRLKKDLLAVQGNHFQGNDKIRQYYEDIIGAISDPETPYRRTLVRNRMTDLVWEFLKHTKKPLNKSVSSPDIAKALEIINSGKYPNIKINDLADEVQLSPTRFQEKFKKEVGAPPAEFILRTRINAAKRLMEKGNSISSVAFELEFSSSQNLSTAFKRITGMSPSQYQKKMKA